MNEGVELGLEALSAFNMSGDDLNGRYFLSSVRAGGFRDIGIEERRHKSLQHVTGKLGWWSNHSMAGRFGTTADAGTKTVDDAVSSRENR